MAATRIAGRCTQTDDNDTPLKQMKTWDFGSADDSAEVKRTGRGDAVGRARSDARRARSLGVATESF